MNRITATITATVAAFLLATPAAWADTAPVVTDPFTGEVVDCWNEPIEVEPGVWGCTPADEAADFGLDTPVEEPDEVTPEDFVLPTDDEQVDEPDPVAATEAPEVVIVEGDGDWGWSDAREMYRG
jgi:hypothetical protein